MLTHGISDIAREKPKGDRKGTPVTHVSSTPVSTGNGQCIKLDKLGEACGFWCNRVKAGLGFRRGVEAAVMCAYPLWAGEAIVPLPQISVVGVVWYVVMNCRTPCFHRRTLENLRAET